jgi:hypothetical protein
MLPTSITFPEDPLQALIYKKIHSAELLVKKYKDCCTLLGWEGYHLYIVGIFFGNGSKFLTPNLQAHETICYIVHVQILF